MTEYQQTHKQFEVDCNQMDWWEIVKLLREHLGDNDPLMRRAKRQWFTNGYTVWIRRDCLDNPFVTWLMLQVKTQR